MKTVDSNAVGTYMIHTDRFAQRKLHKLYITVHKWEWINGSGLDCSIPPRGTFVFSVLIIHDRMYHYGYAGAILLCLISWGVYGIESKSPFMRSIYTNNLDKKGEIPALHY